MYLLLLLPSQGGWHGSSGWQYADLPRIKTRKLSNVFAIKTPAVSVQSQKLKRSWEFFYTSVSSICSLGSLLLHKLMDLCSEIIILTNFGQQLHYVPNENKEKLIWLMGLFVVGKSRVIFSETSFPVKYPIEKRRHHWLQQIIFMPILEVQAYAK